jgi:pilus assembly protein Flp/PilA
MNLALGVYSKRGESMRTLGQFLQDEEGVTAIEYDLIAALIAVAAIAAMKGVGTQLGTLFTTAKTKMR